MTLQIPPPARLAPLLERLPLAQDRPWIGVSAMLAASFAALVIRLAVDWVLPAGYPFVAFFPVVIGTSFLFGVRIGAACAILCGLFAWYFFIPPAYALDWSGGTAIALGFYSFVCVTDILLVHWMQRANRRLATERERNAALAETRELLFRELQHRVSNNLQVTAALLTLQKRHVEDQGARVALAEASRRVGVIGRISRHLYAADGSAGRLRDVLEPLSADVIDASGKQVTLVIGDCDAALPSDAAIPVALIVAEAVANALEHGFADRPGGRIEIDCAQQAEGTLVITVRDDGLGLPPGFAVEESPSLGLRIVTMLAGQLGARFELTGGQGTTARLVLPAAA